MNPQSMILLGLIIGFSLWVLLRNRKKHKGNGGCCGDCSACKGHCGRK